VVLRILYSRDCRSVINPVWLRLAAQQSGVRPRFSGLLGSRLPRPSSIFAAPSCSLSSFSLVRIYQI